MEPETIKIDNDNEVIKLIKNTKGFNWEIRLLKDKALTDKDWVNRLEQINNLMCVRFGSSAE